MGSKISYKEIVRLTIAGGYSQREIAASAGCAASTVSHVQKRIRSSGINADSVLTMSERELRGLLTEEAGRKQNIEYVQPDHVALQQQLDNHPGLTLMILWEEYAKRC